MRDSEKKERKRVRKEQGTQHWRVSPQGSSPDSAVEYQSLPPTDFEFLESNMLRNDTNIQELGTDPTTQGQDIRNSGVTNVTGSQTSFPMSFTSPIYANNRPKYSILTYQSQSNIQGPSLSSNIFEGISGVGISCVKSTQKILPFQKYDSRHHLKKFSPVQSMYTQHNSRISS